MKRTIILCFLIFSFLTLYADEISFSSSSSEISLKEGRRQITLSENAVVDAGNVRIQAEEITLSGNEWERVEAKGNIIIDNEEEGINIKTSVLYYDRVNERILISSFLEINDRMNEVSAYAGHLDYLMDDGILTLSLSVNMNIINDDDVVRIRAERVVYNRNENTVLVSGNADVIWRGDEYRAQVITMDLDEERIEMRSNIEALIHD
ncbi:MAG TPA: hypothetical protein IAB12_05020 [Candidatus Ornithospirochaeta avicola]|uniref:Organic solvent tolerance-like N-terminal domain-containing protein n=1 Tax=Candidatus Ornithospirochaeta avicola TaxID=2840896 RepID=A0A9D1TNB1_9SPIO|nr:hypothetical protein [Candidatus Ornithospirochaeta avicola]